MFSPTVTEVPRRLDSISRDPFIEAGRAALTRAFAATGARARRGTTPVRRPTAAVEASGARTAA